MQIPGKAFEVGHEPLRRARLAMDSHTAKYLGCFFWPLVVCLPLAQ
ncbi:hypothetical protein E2320_021916, partial [Naja naja]